MRNYLVSKMLTVSITFSTFFVTALVPNIVRAEDRTARIYEIGKTSEKPVFIQSIHTEKASDGIETRTSTIADETGKLAMKELAVFEGTRLISQDVTQAQAGLAYDVRVKDGKVIFRELKLVDGSAPTLVSEKSESPKGTFLTGPLSDNFVRAHWEELIKGERLEARFGVLELGETVGFAFKRKAMEKILNRETLVLEMKPSSFFINFMVDPIELYFDVVDKVLVRYRGRTPLSRLVDGKKKPFDAEIIYEAGRGAQ